MIVLFYDNTEDSSLLAATSMVVSAGHKINVSFFFIEQRQHLCEAAVKAASSYEDIDDSSAGSNVNDLLGNSNNIDGNFSG